MMSFFQFMANLEITGSQIPDALPVKITCPLTATFYLTKTENRTKKSLIQHLHYSYTIISSITLMSFRQGE